MKNVLMVILAAAVLAGSGSAALAQMMEHPMDSHEQVSGQMEKEMKPEEGMNMPGGMEIKALQIDNYNVNFHIMDDAATHRYMDTMGHKGHKLKEGMSHYVMMEVTDLDGRKISRAKVKMKVIGPDGKAQEKAAFPMMGSFGAEFDMKQMGKYQIMTLFKIGDTQHKGGFWHEMK